MYYNKNDSRYRNLIFGLNKRIPINNGKFTTAINFDNAATTPPFRCVMDEIFRFSGYYSSIHRGAGYKSLYSSRAYEDSRKIICDFLGCDYNENIVIYVKNTTEAINKLCSTLYTLDKDSVILSTRMEHHSNDLPWRNKFKVDYVEIDPLGRLNMYDLEKKLRKYNGKIKLVCVTGASNVTGYVNPIHKIATLSHNFGAKILVDGAQLVPHSPIHMGPNSSKQHIDYLTFSAHKMYAPFGIGVLIGPKETFIDATPDHPGGGTVRVVTDDEVIWADPPDKNEAGSPNVIGVIALVSAIKALTKLGMDNIAEREMNLYNYALKHLLEIPEIKLYTDINNNSPKVSILPFNIDGISHNETASLLSSMSGISVRNGCFCAQPYVHRLLNLTEEEIQYYKNNPNLPRPGLVRLSFGLYNSKEEIDIFIKTLKKIITSQYKRR